MIPVIFLGKGEWSLTSVGVLHDVTFYERLHCDLAGFSGPSRWSWERFNLLWPTSEHVLILYWRGALNLYSEKLLKMHQNFRQKCTGCWN